MTVTTDSDGNSTYNYLTVDGTSLKTVTSYSSASAWTREATGDGYAYSSGGAYLYYDTTTSSWTTKKSEQIINIQAAVKLKSKYHYLFSEYSGSTAWTYNSGDETSYVGSVKGAINSASAAQWHMSDAGLIYTAADGTNKYLNVSGGALSLDTTGQTVWTTSSAGLVDETESYYFTTTSGGTTYYLNFKWVRENTFSQNRVWCVSTSDSESTSSVINGNTPRMYMISVGSGGDISDYKCTQTEKKDGTGKTATITYAYTISETTTATYATYDTVFPITINETDTSSYPTGGYTTRTESDENGYANTGYFVGGAQQTTSYATGNIRVSKYPVNTSLTAALNGASSYIDSRLEILTRTKDGQFRIEDDVNKDNSSVSSDISGYDKKSLTDLGLNETRYNEAREDLTKVLTADTSNVYGLHFMNATISRSNLVTFPTAYINGTEYTNRLMPRNCADFMLNSSGYITFFAGTYYSGNQSFFSLHHIYRDDAGNITSIKEMSKVYEDSDGTYVYEYTEEDGTTTYSVYDGGTYGTPTSAAPSCVNDSNLKFDMKWLINPEDFILNAVYYFQIPANKGEYALGSTSSNGAYLFYLDICSNPDASLQKFTRVESLEKTTSGVSSCPDGVGFGTVKDAAIALPFGANTAASAETAGDDEDKRTTSVTISPAVADSTDPTKSATCSYAASYAATSTSDASQVKVYNGADDMTATSDSTTKYVYTITEYNKTLNSKITQVGKVKSETTAGTSIGSDGTFTIADDDIDILEEKSGDFADVSISWADKNYKLKNDSILTYEYQISSGNNSTVTIAPRFTYNTKYSTTAGSTADNSKGTDAITITSTSEKLTLKNFDVQSGYTVTINSAPVTGSTESLDVEVSSGS